MAAGFFEASSEAVGALVFFFRVFEGLFFGNFGFGLRVVAGGVEILSAEVTVAATGLTPAAGGVEGEVVWIERFKGFTSGRRNAGGGEAVEFSFGIERLEGAFPDLQGLRDEGGGVGFFLKCSDDEVDIMCLMTGERLEVFGADEFAIDEHFYEAGALSGLGVFFVEAFTASENGGKEAERFFFFKKGAELLSDGFGCL